jgi:DNA repair exonuclease SbcCD nuclease subunit
MIKIAHISDVHLGAKLAYLNTKAEEHRQRIKEAFKLSIDKAIETKVDLFIIAGDLFDNPFPSKVSQVFVLEQFKRLIDNNIYTLVITGNHDRSEVGSVFTDSLITKYVNPRLKIFNKELLQSWEIADLDLCIFAAGTEKQKNKNTPYSNLMRSEKFKYNIGVFHGSVDIKGQPENNPIYLKDLYASGFDYFALGDWHNMLDLSKNGVAISYCGSPELIDSDQDNAGNMLIVTLDKGQPCVVKSLRTGSIKSKTMDLDVSQIGEIAQLVEQVKAMTDHSLILTLNIKGQRAISLDYSIEELRTMLGESFYYVVIKDDSTLRISEQDLLNYPEHMLIGKYIKLMLAQKNDDSKNNERIDRALQLGVSLLKGGRL